MQITWGVSRFVILIGNIAIKIARPRPLWVLRKLAQHLQTGEVQARLTERYGSPFLGGLRYVLLGVMANRIESRLWKHVPQKWMIPTLWSCGLINIQRRGIHLKDFELKAEHPFQADLKWMSEEMCMDLSASNNFCRLDGKVCLCDYGSLAVEAWLKGSRRATAASFAA